jgi:nucleoside-diphosphate-sugar epimerase
LSEPVFRDPPPVTVVTGAAGWLGTALLHALAERGGTVRALVRHPAEVDGVLSAGRDVQIHIGDVTDRAVVAELLAGTDGADVLHAAGVIHPRRTEEFERVNVGGTRAVVDAARAAGARRLVHVSSNSPFGLNPTPTDRFRSEEPFNPYMGYGHSKMLAEELVRAADGDGLETTVVRPPWFYGPYQPARQTRFFTAVRLGRFPLFGDGTNRRSMAYVEALADGILRAQLAEGAAGRAYWIADARPYEMAEVLETVREALRLEGYETSPRQPRVPGVLADAARVIDGALQARGRYVQEIHVLSEMNATIACDVSLAERELGYIPPTSLLDGMRASIRWCREQGIEL